jgi:hypothetical protein
MRRILLVLATMAMLVAMATPSLAQQGDIDIPPPGDDSNPPGNQQSPENKVLPTQGPTGAPDQAQNCYGQSQFTGFAGPATPFPGSAANPAQFDPDGPEGDAPTQDFFSGPAHKYILQSDTTPGGGNPISDIQHDARDTLASESDCPEG